MDNSLMDNFSERRKNKGLKIYLLWNILYKIYVLIYNRHNNIYNI